MRDSTMTSNKIEINIADFEQILLCAFRYCLGRETAASSIFISYITQDNIWYYITNDLKIKILDEIQHYKKLGNINEFCMAEWDKLAVKITEELN